MSDKKPMLSVVRNTDMGVIQLSSSLSDGSLLSTDASHDLPVTPMSPSSKYTKSELPEIPGSVISAAVLSQWDNILGPRVQHVWRIKGVQAPTSDLLSHITSQVLSCEICRDVYTCAIDFKFYNLPDRDVLVPAFVFSARGLSGIAVHALFLIIPRTQLKFYLETHDILCCCFNRLATKLRVLMDRNPFNVMLDVFSPSLCECLIYLQLTYAASLAQNIRFSDTAFCPEHVLEKDFLAKCVSSHLMTFGRSLVVGETAERINLVLHTLAFFNSPAERRCSLLVSVDHPRPYHHDFYLQGLLKNKKGFFLPMTEILVSRYPTTIIDITTREVKQTLPYNDHIVHRFETQKNELICLQYGHYEQLVTLNNELHPVSAYPDTAVQEFVREIFELPELCWVREAYITQFLRLLHKKAQCLLEYVKAESNEGAQPLKASIVKKMRQDLSLTSEGDYRIVLAVAEKLRPGIFVFLLGDRKYDHIKPLEIL